MTHRVLLISGFFGFEAVGELRYFEGVGDALRRAYEAEGEEADVREVRTLPTASIRDRAARVLEALEDLAEAGSGPIHLVGHSTGGLDGRLAIAPSASLNADVGDPAALRERVTSLVTVSTPHGGSPLATFFASAAGQPLLRAITALGALVLDRGTLPVSVVVKLGDMLRNFDDVIGLKGTVLDELYERLLNDLTEERREAIVELLGEISKDAALVFQLTPEGVDLLDAATGDPDEIRYGCVITRSPQPTFSQLRALRHDVYGHATYLIYILLSALASQTRTDITVNDAQAARLRELLGEVPPSSAHDGIVPTLAQAWGEVVAAATADHLDLVGHYGNGEGSSDWLPSGSGFDTEAFHDVWARVARFQLGSV
ncbi:MAG: triacylglycerol lipase [Myxococcota bacterium]|nr:triacylglycerol lipase [Myxococcota bacterium]